MSLNQLIAICGPKCTECEAYQATRKDRQACAEVAAKWTKWMKKEYTADDVVCDGCRVEGGRMSAYCGGCDIRACAQAKGHETCAHCPECPCDKIVAPPAIAALAELKAALGRGE